MFALEKRLNKPFSIKNFISTEFLFSLALFSFGLYYYCFRILGCDLSYTPGDYGDSRFINYILEHGYRWLIGKENDFWQANFMYPLKNNVAISDSMIGSLPLYALFRFMGKDTETAYQLWWLSSCILNFVAAFYALGKFKFRPYLAALGAYVFAFGINNFNQFVHLQFNCKFLVPIACVYFYLFIGKPNFKTLVVLSIALLWQFFCSAYITIFLVMFFFFVSVFYFISTKNRENFFEQWNKGLALKSLVLLSAVFALFLTVAGPYFQMSRLLGKQQYENIVSYLPQCSSYFFPDLSAITWNFLCGNFIGKIENWWTHNYFAGGFTYFGFLFSFFYLPYCMIKQKKTNTLLTMAVIACLMIIALFTRTESHFSLFQYFQNWPVFGSMRVPGRFMIVLNFVFIVMSLYYINLFFKRFHFLIIFLLAIVVVGDNLFSVTPPFVRSEKLIRVGRTQYMKNLILKENKNQAKVVVVLNTNLRLESYQLDVMLATQEMDLYTLNGYSSTCYQLLCGAYNDPKHHNLSLWLKEHQINEKDVSFIELK